MSKDRVEISELALAALVFAAEKHIKKRGPYDFHHDRFGEIPIVRAMKEAVEPLGLTYDPFCKGASNE